MEKKQVRKTVIYLMIALMLLFTLTACGGGSENSAGSGENAEGITTVFPEFTTTDLEGNTVDNSVFSEADVTVVNFWGTYCPPCIREMPELAEWADEMPDNVQIIGVVIDVPMGDKSSDKYKEALRITGKAGVTFTNLEACEDMIPLLEQLVGVPTTFFIGPNGSVLAEPIVGADVAGYKSTVEELL